MKNNLHDLQDFAGVSEQEIFFDDLQPLFDDHSRRLADILDCPATRPSFLNISDAPTFRFRMVRAWGILALLCLVATISWGIALWHYNYDIYYRLFTLFIEFVYILITVESIATTFTILRHDPARISFDRMLRLTRRSGMHPLYMSQKKSRPAVHIARHRSRRPSPRTLSNTFNSQFIIGNLKRTATIGIAASFTLVLIACTTTVGDGYTLTQDHNARLEAIAGVTSIIEQI